MSLEVYPQSGPPGPIGPTASVLFSAGSLSSVRSDISFNNSNGVTFGLDAGGVITATVQTNYQSAGAYLTTAALSQDSSKYAGTTAGMTGGSLTVDTAGVAISLPAYLTTAQPPGAYLTTAMASDRGSDFVQATAGFFGTNATGTIASNGISVSVNAGGGSLNISAGSTSSNVSAVTFSNGSGVTFGFDGSNVTASVQTNYQTPGAYLTTAALSQDSSKYAGTNGAITGGSITVNTSGVSVNLPAYLTTAMQSNAATITNVKVSAGTLSSDRSDVTFGDSNGVSFGLDTNGVVTATVATNYQSQGAYLTTAALSQDSSKYAGTGFTTSSTAGSQFLGTLNSSGLSLLVPVSSFNVSAPGFGINCRQIEFDNANGVTFGASTNITDSPIFPHITATVRTNYAGTNTSVATTTGTDLSFAANTSGITIAYPKWLTAASGGGAGTGFTTATTAGTAVVGTLDSNGLSMGVPAYLTTAALSGDTSKYAGTATSVVTTTGTDLSMALNTNGLTVAYPKWITTAAGGGVAISNSQSLFSTGTVALSEGGGAITIASSAGGQSLMFSVPQTSSIVGVAPASISTGGSTISVLVSAIEGVGVSNTGNTAGNVGYITGSNYALAGSGSITLSQSTAAGAATAWIQHPAWITTAAQSSAMMSWFQNMDMLDPGSTLMSYGGSVLQVCPFILPHAMSVGFVRMAGSMSYVSTEASGTTANTTYTVNRSYTHAVMLFTQNTGANSLSLNLLTSSSASWLFQNQIQAGAQGSRYTVTQNVTYPISGTTSNYTTSYPQSSANIQISSASLTLFTGPRFIDIPFGVSLPANNYWIAFGMSTNSATQAGNAALGGASAGFSMIAVTQNNITFGLMGQVTNSSNGIQPGCGSWSTNSAVMTTNSIALANVSAMSSNPHNYFQFIRYA